MEPFEVICVNTKGWHNAQKKEDWVGPKENQRCIVINAQVLDDGTGRGKMAEYYILKGYEQCGCYNSSGFIIPPPLKVEYTKKEIEVPESISQEARQRILEVDIAN